MHLTSFLTLGLAATATALNTLKVVGSEFQDSVTNARFEIIGVAYQPGGSAGFMPQNGVDPLSNATACLRDAILMQQLGINTIRVYNLDPAVNHDACASIFNAAGIYMIIDVNSPLPNGAIDADNPGDSYNPVYLQRIFQVVQAFMNYSNLLGFFAANEVINTVQTGQIDPPYIRAVTRDLKEYIAKHAPRTIPVGYSAADVSQILFDTWEYLQCAIDGNSDDQSRIDFFGLNSYSWCGDSATYQTSGYDTFVSGFGNTTVPIFFSEYGCNLVLPRTFPEVGTIYGSQMLAVLSGGLVYEWTQETNNFGLVNINTNNTLSLLVDYTNLQNQYNKLDMSNVMSAKSTATNTQPPTCASSLIVEQGFNNSWTIPSTPSGAVDYISNGVTGAAGGSSVAVTNTNMPVQVYGVSGQPITGLSLKVVSTSNTPSGTNTGSDAATTSKSAAVPLGDLNGLSYGVGAMGILGLLLW